MEKRLLPVAACCLCLATLSALTAGSLYVSNQRSGEVNFYDPVTGVLQGSVGTYSIPTGLNLDSAGNLYVAAFGEDRVYRVDPSSGVQTVFSTFPSGSGPFSLAFDPSGDVYISSRRAGSVSKYAADGAFLGSVSVPGAGGISFNPIDGNLYVSATAVASAGTTNSVLRITPGLVASAFATTNLDFPIFTFIDPAGKVAVSNGGNAGSIVLFNLDGSFNSTIAPNIFAPNQIAPAPGGGYYVTSFGDNDVLLCPGAGGCSVFIDQGTGVGTSGVVIAATLVPEPASVSLIVLGFAGLLVLRRRSAAPARTDGQPRRRRAVS